MITWIAHLDGATHEPVDYDFIWMARHTKPVDYDFKGFSLT